LSPLLDLRNLKVHYRRGWHKSKVLKAVDGVTLTIEPGETVGLVGESGSGKTSLGRAVLGLTPVTDGQVLLEGVDITHASRKERRVLSLHLQASFQDPFGSLNPTKTIGSTLKEPLSVHMKLGKSEARDRVEEMLAKVGLPPDTAQRYPSQFSGGQRQRIAIARALMLSPRLVICDEPVSSLDLSIQAQVLNLLSDLQQQLSLSYLFIAHDLAVVRYLSKRVVVMYRGRVMETGPAQAVHDNPKHPYTRALLSAAPIADPRQQSERRLLRLEYTNRLSHEEVVSGCPFRPRCPFAVDRCREAPPLRASGQGGQSACWRADELPPWTAVSESRVNGAFSGQPGIA